MRFQPLLESMMAKDRTERISDATTLVAEIEKYQRHEIEADRAELDALREETHCAAAKPSPYLIVPPHLDDTWR